MGWYKINHGLPLEVKLTVIARRAGFRRGDVLALWVVLLDHASRAVPRGAVRDVDVEEIAATLEFEAAAIETALTAFREKNMISADGSLVGWEKSQRLSTPRARAYRARAVAELINEGESDDARRRRLQNEILDRHRKKGRMLAEPS